ncbi:MAG: metallophosphoesterase [Chitinophagaceae bacterium]|nr:metallophosphoesterase [Chitinophagaceae bacterium]
MKRILVATVLIVLVQQMTAQPYVFYKRKKIIVATLDSPAVNIESFPLSEKEKHTVQVNFPGNESWNFTVALKKINNDSVISKSADTILFLSDIEGEFELLRQMLIANKIMDESYNWIFGTGELVICGDLFDRGFAVTQQLWLLYKLESAAGAKGGSVHVLLGNHEIMNLSGDLRYVQPAYFDHARLLGKDYMQLFDEDTELGRWLRSKNIVERTGRFLVMHAGISWEILNRKLSLESINEMVRPWYAKWKSDLPDYFSDFFNANSPFWYRGYFDEPPAMQNLVISTLARYKAEKIIVGHTIRYLVSSFYDGKLWDINTNWHAGNAQGLLVEGDKFFRVNNRGLRTALN